MSTHGDKTQSDRDRILRGACVTVRVIVRVCMCRDNIFRDWKRVT